MKENMIVRTTEFALKILAEYLQPGDTALDATMGNGHDTLALARLVGVPEGRGRVYAFDVQQKALENTSDLLNKNHCTAYVVQDRNRNIEQLLSDEEGSVLLFLESHENIALHIRRPVSGAIFNLGYMPGEGREIITRPQTTVTALKQVESILEINGIIVVVIYSGHPGGMGEKQAVLTHMEQLHPSEFHAGLIASVNQPQDAPCIALITRKK